MLEAYSRAWTEIDYDAIRHNVNEVRKLVKNTKIMGIVKANAYGLGDIACAKVYKNVVWTILEFQVLMKKHLKKLKN